MNKDNVVQVVKGAPATNPAPPDDIDDAMLLATLRYEPYVFDVEADVSIVETNFKRYTFRDIQVLEDRIKTLEYYTQLSLLEGETAGMEIRDASGLSRYKNGFIVDNFASLATADTLHPDFRVSVDFEEGQMRPAHYTTQVPLAYGTSSANVQETNDIITLPYSDAVLIDQPYASAVENVNPFNVFTYVGDVVRANILASQSKLVGKGESINIGNGDNRSVNQIADLIGGPKEYIEKRLEPQQTLADNTKAKDLLNWKSTTTVEEWIPAYKKQLGI